MEWTINGNEKRVNKWTIARTPSRWNITHDNPYGIFYKIWTPGSKAKKTWRKKRNSPAYFLILDEAVEWCKTHNVEDFS